MWNNTSFQVLVRAQIFQGMPRARSWHLTYRQNTVPTSCISAAASSLKLLIPSQPHHRVQMAREASSKQPDIIWHPGLSTGHTGDMSKASCSRVLTACLLPRADVCQTIENKSSQELIPLPLWRWHRQAARLMRQCGDSCSTVDISERQHLSGVLPKSRPYV